MDLDDGLDGVVAGVAVPGIPGQAPGVEGAVDREVVPVALGGIQDRVEFDELDRPVGRGAPGDPCLPDRREQLDVRERGQIRGECRDVAEGAQQRGVRGCGEDCHVRGDRPLDGGAGIREREDGLDLWEEHVRREPVEQPGRVGASGLPGVRSEPRARAPAHAKGLEFGAHRLDQAALRGAFASHHEVREVATGPQLVEPELPPAGRPGAVHEEIPVYVVDVPLGTGTDEPGGDHRASIEVATAIQCAPVDQPP